MRHLLESTCSTRLVEPRKSTACGLATLMAHIRRSAMNTIDRQIDRDGFTNRLEQIAWSKSLELIAPQHLSESAMIPCPAASQAGDDDDRKSIRVRNDEKTDYRSWKSLWKRGLLEQACTMKPPSSWPVSLNAIYALLDRCLCLLLGLCLILLSLLRASCLPFAPYAPLHLLPIDISHCMAVYVTRQHGSLPHQTSTRPCQ